MSTFDTPDPITARVAIARGSVHLVAADRADTVVTVQPRDADKPNDARAAERTRVEYGNGLLAVTANRGLSFGRSGAVDVVIELPSHSILRVSVASAEVRADGEFGDVRFESASGDLDVQTITGEVRVDTASGAASLGRLTGDITFATASGDLTVKELRGNARAASASGSVNIGTAVSGALVFQTASGDTSLGIAPGTAARLDINTYSGTVTNALEHADGPAAGEEKFLLHVRAASGDVDLHRPVAIAT